MTIKIKCNKNPWANRIELLIADVSSRGKMGVAKNVAFELIDEGEYVEPTLTIDGQSAQELMDSLWFAGIRPTEGAGSVGQLAATERHLNDMRKLVFEK